MSGTLVGRFGTPSRQRLVRWALQGLLVVGAWHPAVGFLLPAVVPLLLDSPLRLRLSTPRGRLLGHAARVLCVVSFGIHPWDPGLGLTTMLAGAAQSAGVFAGAFVLSRYAFRSPSAV